MANQLQAAQGAGRATLKRESSCAMCFGLLFFAWGRR